ncbi:MAG: class I SAM-dependent methyltransferase [Pseudomonadota bacterium]|uniref:class I SAM-dependent methyltransferase n=1 Tax=Thermithiobacillus tepidarius TaxID=929 RepID=UPI00041CF0FD|nr:class I SAM-dependent methyltransferase [Thermithiobacillus tepidarius]
MAERSANLEARLFPATVMPDRDWWQALWPNPAEVLQALGVGAGLSVVDLGCGDGHFTAALAQLAAPGRVTGLDLDPALLAQAQAVCPHCHWILGDAMALSRLLPEAVDYVLMANTFHGVPDKAALVREVAAVLKPGGRFAVVNWHPLPREQTPVLGQPRGPRTELRLAPAQVQAVAEPAGLRLASLVELPPYHYGILLQKH